MEEHVVLVNDDDKVLGTAPKATVHTKKTPLHRAFSSFIFNPKGELLLAQRCGLKKTWPLVWTNSCCGHPALNENTIDAVRRRVREELGLVIDEIFEVLPDYRYRAKKDGIVENELCPVFIAFTDNQPNINGDEVETERWMPWAKFVEETKNNPTDWSPWCVEEVMLLKKNYLFKNLFKKNTNL
ncbi:MAG: isopentenyl-diphosphate Delta-isomerase [bacterium]|nr:isopentenyl-diphosphate Delta-isomerase [bacterium]